MSRAQGPKTVQQRPTLTLEQLLDTDQPYKYLDQLDDPAVELSNDDKNNDKLRRIQGSLIGLAVGDALGASVEFRPNSYLKENEVTDMMSGGTWGLEKGQWTDDTSMTLCLAASLLVKGKSDPYDQFMRYKRWFRDGYMSSTGKCFDIGKSTREAIMAFEERREKIRTKLSKQDKSLKEDKLDELIEKEMRKDGKSIKFATDNSAGNGSLMRLAPIPCFFFDSYDEVKECITEATATTHSDDQAIDACKFYAGLIWYALNGIRKDKLLSEKFYYEKFESEKFHPEIERIAKGSYKTKNGYEGGIRGKGYVVDALEAALWAFYNDNNDFYEGVLLAVNLGDDTDTTAAIYGQLAGACYKVDSIKKEWCDALYKGHFIMTVAKSLYVKGSKMKRDGQKSTWPDRSQKNTDDHGRSNTERTQSGEQLGATGGSSSPQPKHNQNQPSSADTKEKPRREQLGATGTPSSPQPKHNQNQPSSANRGEKQESTSANDSKKSDLPKGDRHLLSET